MRPQRPPRGAAAAPAPGAMTRPRISDVRGGMAPRPHGRYVRRACPRACRSATARRASVSIGAPVAEITAGLRRRKLAQTARLAPFYDVSAAGGRFRAMALDHVGSMGVGRPMPSVNFDIFRPAALIAWVSHPARRRPLEVGRWRALELLFAAYRAEIIGRPMIGDLRRGVLGINLHAAYRIGRHLLCSFGCFRDLFARQIARSRGAHCCSAPAIGPVVMRGSSLGMHCRYAWLGASGYCQRAAASLSRDRWRRGARPLSPQLLRRSAHGNSGARQPVVG